MLRTDHGQASLYRAGRAEHTRATASPPYIPRADAAPFDPYSADSKIQQSRIGDGEPLH